VFTMGREEERVKVKMEPGGDDFDDTDSEDRMQWGSPLQFFCTILGFCVGLGNIWRFPYLCQKNGGGAFIIPFMVMLFLVGTPLLLLELALGQRFRVGAAAAWPKIHPALSGIGYGSSVVATLVGCYYNAIIAWCLFYLWSSFTTELPWAKCPHDYITGKNMTECEMSSETQYFWFRTTLDSSDSLDNFDSINWKILATLTIAWVGIYLILMKGIASSGKVVYFTAMFPYFVLTIFFFRGITLTGATVGLMHMFTPKLEKLLEPTVWLEAANQVFYSFGLAFGSIISFGSYNNPQKNCVKDVLMISVANLLTAVYGCAVIFSILGFKAVHMYTNCMQRDILILEPEFPEFTGRLIHDIPEEEYMLAVTKSSKMAELRNCSLADELNSAAGGTGLAFIVMAEVFVQIPAAPVWSILFFLMLLSLGVGSQIGILEGVISMLFDHPKLKYVKKPILVGVVVVGSYMVGLLFVTGSGEYWLTLFDTFGATGLTIIALVEIICVMYVYGHKRFSDDIETMTGYRPGLYWQIMWRFVSPSVMTIIVTSSVYSMFKKYPTYTAWNKEKASTEELAYPGWSLAIAALLSVASLIPILIGLCVWGRRGFNRDENPGDYEPGIFHRVDTSASTRPMLDSFDIFHKDEDRFCRESDTSSDAGITTQDSNSDNKSFKLEVVDS